MTEIVPNLHQIGARELNELANADLVIDMGGILGRTYASYLGADRLSEFKQAMNVPILSFEIDEVDDEPFYEHKYKLHHIHRVAAIGAQFITNGLVVYTLCLAGQNRSGLINALILMLISDRNPQEVIALIREKRENALNNEQINKFLLEYNLNE